MPERPTLKVTVEGPQGSGKQHLLNGLGRVDIHERQIGAETP